MHFSNRTKRFFLLQGSDILIGALQFVEILLLFTKKYTALFVKRAIRFLANEPPFFQKGLCVFPHRSTKFLFQAYHSIKQVKIISYIWRKFINRLALAWATWIFVHSTLPHLYKFTSPSLPLPTDLWTFPNSRNQNQHCVIPSRTKWRGISNTGAGILFITPNSREYAL